MEKSPEIRQHANEKCFAQDRYSWNDSVGIQLMRTRERQQSYSEILMKFDCQTITRARQTDGMTETARVHQQFKILKLPRLGAGLVHAKDALSL
jgi:hypothetical protein